MLASKPLRLAARALHPATTLSLLFVALLTACEPAAPKTRGDATPPVATDVRPAFWQIDGASGGRLFLLGSIHVGPVGGWKLPAEALALFDGSDALLVEADMREGSPAEQDDAVLRHALLPPGESVENHLSAETYASLEQLITANGKSMANIHPWKPWMIATMLLLEELQRLGYPTEAGLDLDLMERAGDTKPVIGIETAEEQLRLLGGLSAENQELMLKDMLLQMSGIEAHFDALKDAWREGDTAALEKLLFEELERTPELAPFYEAVIYGRNETMCERLDAHFAADQTLFGVVGAAHLVGPRGIPTCLAEKGHSVERVSNGGS
ncbi:MAG: TraB/GumN family protein [Myxococcota bacterium]|nr:TraB/GumN family protein [Myxococcota bacterium]